MKKTIYTALFLALCLALVGCAKNPAGGSPPPPNTIQSGARDTSAALNGFLTNAQAKYQTSCKANPNQTPCLTINKGIAAQNTLITALDTYCGWSSSVAPPDPSAACVPVASAQQALITATENAAALITQIRGIL
jgi:hypothetical protein